MSLDGGWRERGDFEAGVTGSNLVGCVTDCAIHPMLKRKDAVSCADSHQARGRLSRRRTTSLVGIDGMKLTLQPPIPNCDRSTKPARFKAHRRNDQPARALPPPMSVSMNSYRQTVTFSTALSSLF